MQEKYLLKQHHSWAREVSQFDEQVKSLCSPVHFLCLLSYVVRHKKKTRLTLQLGNQKWEGRDKQTPIEHVLTCHSVKRLSLIALLSKSGHIFKHRHVLILGRKVSDCKSEQRVNIKFLVKLKKSATETFQLLTLKTLN